MKHISLKGKTVAILATDGFEQSELIEPLLALRSAGATVKIVSLELGSIRGWKKSHWGQFVEVDTTVEKARASDFDALILPGGVMNPDKLRMNEHAVAFVREMGESGKTIAAICHGPWTLINADLVHGRALTSWPSLEADLTNAGAKWMDQEVVVDNGLVTSRNPSDLPAFNAKV
ncbi:MAG: type 1 glutamine amidotransferase domain-containing protein, partial [Bdellovibrionota bacterium]